MLTRSDTVRAVSLAIVCMAACGTGPEHHCLHDRDSRDWSAAFESCQAEFAKTSDLARAIDAALAAYYLHRRSDAMRLARLALAGPTAADAHYLIGSTEHELGEYGSAASHLKEAARLHAALGQARAEARDYQQLSGVFYQIGDYQHALDTEAAGRDAAQRAHDERLPVYFDLARADILRAIGDLRGAEQATEHVVAAAREPAERVHGLLRQGILHIEQGHAGLARDPLTRALEAELATRFPSPPILEALHLNLAYVERKARAFPRALEEMELANKLGTDVMSYRLNRGLVFADMGKLAEARADLEAAEAEKPEGEWSWWVSFQQARVAARQQDITGAIEADRRSIDRVATLALSSGAFGPTVIANHREPHLHLVGLLAAAQRWNDVLDVVAAMDRQSLLDSSEVSADPAPSPVNASSPPSQPTPRSAPDAAQLAVEAWRGRVLVIVVPGGDRVWRLDVHDGRAAGGDVGDVGALGELARKLETDPGNAEAGRQLGQAMLPPVAPRTRIELLVIGPLARAPLGALRVSDGPAIARYQLVRATGLLPRTATGRASAAAIAIGDPNDDLPAAADEARKVAARLKGSAVVGAEATRAAFARTAGAELLHVAAHTTRRLGSATLELADGPVSLAEIAKLVPAPRLVVLASCGAAAGRDDAGNGSLTTAFIDAGAEVVIGTRWSVGDAEAAQFVEAFYAAGGGRDPVRALGEAQRASKLPATTWAAFEAFVARPVR